MRLTLESAGCLLVAGAVAAGCSRGPRAPAPPSTGAPPVVAQRPDTGPGARRDDLTALHREGLEAVLGTQSERTCCSATDSTQAIGGWTVGDAYGVEWVAARGGQYLSLDSLTGRRDGHPLWRVLDAVWLPEYPDSLRFVAGCATAAALAAGDSVADNAVMGIAVPEPAPFLSTVVFAWRADTVTRRFVVEAPGSLRCVNQGWGID
jgi:hypothetical protein